MIKIRRATKKDIGAMLKIIKLNSPKYPLNYAKKELMEMFSNALNRPTYLLIEDNKEIAAFGGFIRSWIDSMIFNIFWVNTHPKHANRGFGTKLIDGLINEIARIQKNPKAKMIIISTKIPSFYEKFGFRKITRKYDNDYVLMEKVLK